MSASAAANTADMGKPAKRRMQASSSGEVSEAALVPMTKSLYSKSGVETPPPPSVMDVLSAGLQNQVAIASVSDEDSYGGFEDTSETIAAVYTKLMSKHRINICLYNKEHEVCYRLRSLSSSSSPSAASTRRVATPPHSPLVSIPRILTTSTVSTTASGGHHGLSMSLTDMHSRLMPPGVSLSGGSGLQRQHHHQHSSNLRSTSSESLDASVVADLAHTQRPNTMWDVAQIRNHEETPKLSFGEVVGLNSIKESLQEMLAPFVDARKRVLYSVGQSQPERTLFIKSEKGSGVHTLVNATCKKFGVNLIRINYGSETEWEDSLFTKMLDFALAVQPVVVFFDRCEAWFSKDGPGWSFRGDKFLLALEGSASIAAGRADVMFVVSSCVHLSEMNGRFSQWIKPYRSVSHTGTEECDSKECLYQALNMHINDIQSKMQKQHHQSMLEYGGLVDASRGEAEHLEKCLKECESRRVAAKELASKYGIHFKAWTPAMIGQVVSRAIDTARTRELKRVDSMASSAYSYDLLNLIPTAEDLATVVKAIQKPEPGRIIWRSNNN